MFRRKRKTTDFSAEIEAHIQLEIERLRAEGLSEEAAQAAAYRAFGSPRRARETFYESHRWMWLDRLRQDVRFAFRILRKSPGFTAVAILTLALGIGANTAIFSAVNDLLLAPLPYSDASRLVTVTGLKGFPTSGVMGYIGFSPDLAKMILDQSPEFERTATYSTDQLTMTGRVEPQELSVAGVHGDFFSLLGVRPLLGRPILDSDTKPASQHVAVLSYELWNESFNADPHVVGRSIALNRKPYTIVGVMPPRFDFGAGEKGLWTSSSEDGGNIVARVKAGMTLDEVNAQLKVVTARLTSKYPKVFEGCRLTTAQLGRETGGLNDPLLLLFGAVGFVLLIACVNLSSLLLARAWGRRREIAIREALGATRLRLVSQFLVESMLLAFAGGALGMLFAVWGIRALRAIAPPDTPHTNLLRLDPIVLAFTAGISLLAGLLFGIAPALQASARRIGLAFTQKLGGLQSPLSARHPQWLRSVFVIAEVALAFVLVVGATLAALSFRNYMKIPLGFRTDHILTMSVHFSKAVCDPTQESNAVQCRLAMESILNRIQGLPGVRKAAAASSFPLDGSNGALSMHVEGKAEDVGIEHGNLILYKQITPGYFQALGTPLLAGRAFSSADASNSERVALVNELFARQYFSGSPLGHQISLANDKSGKPQWMEVVGEVRDSHDVNLLPEIYPEFYIPLAQAAAPTYGNFIVRTDRDPLAMAAAVKERIWSLDANAPVTNLRTMNQVVASNVATPRFQALLLVSFGALGLLLATIGIYGVISYAVTQRTHEIGVRMTLGAGRGEILRLILGQGALLAVAGIIIGLVGALGLTRFLRSMLFEITPTDPATFIGVALLLLFVALAATYVPARRAMRVDPMVALRYE
ncbi:MAG TPA: ABC transporter permease [Candidatus Acidoferrales bacterium]|nr:ABC transporter permease [Candidatus Acidoferrales bacterium]